MATDIVQSLFGLDPYQTQMQQQDALRQQAAAYANMAPQQRAAMSLYQAGGQLAGAGAEGLFGMVNPAVAKAQATEQALMGLDMTDPQSILAKANSVTDPRLRIQLQLLAQQRQAQQLDAQKKQADIALANAHAKYYGAGGSAGGNNQMMAKIAIARNDAMKIGADLGLKGQDLMDFVDAAEQKVRSIFTGMQSTDGPVRLSPTTTMDIVGGVTPAMKEAMYQDAVSRGDLEAARAIAAIAPSRLDVLPKSKAEVAGDIERAKQGEKVVETTTPTGTAAFARAGDSMGQAPAQYSPQVAGAIAAAKEGASKTAGAAADMNMRQYSQVLSAQQEIPKLDNLINLLENGDVQTGTAAEFRLGMNKLKAFILRKMGGVEGVKAADDTELANVLMGSDVFPLIQALGVGARGMDTPAEREFMRSVLTGSIALEPKTLLQMANMRRQIAANNISLFESRRQKGELKGFYESSGITNEPLTVPVRQMPTMPSPTGLKGKTLRDTVTGARYTSDGTKWVKQ